ncbi:MAG: hypothetical protein M0R32_11105 [Candidatus Cloacimonetes bacterium]|jgi:hypothetical protein|nr:hypothetical protein [Candidatus Cloacimonadota bacterium]
MKIQEKIFPNTDDPLIQFILNFKGRVSKRAREFFTEYQVPKKKSALFVSEACPICYLGKLASHKLGKICKGDAKKGLDPCGYRSWRPIKKS